jgi:hypothetical protein
MTKREVTRRSNANDKLADLCRRYHSSIPLTEIKDILVSNGFDGAAIDGIYTGRDGRMSEQCGERTWIVLVWHKMEVTGQWEITSYLS